MLEYKGYTADIEVDIQAGVLHGRVRDIQDVVTFEAKTAAELERKFHRSIDVYLQFCQETQQEPDRPYPQSVPHTIALEATPDLCRAASNAGKSIDSWAQEVLSDAARRSLEHFA
ncbi:MAG: type II toxin-antitoxin system HicB family antitoxin [Cyanobacteria bacterium J069]|nr:MAG: type II toxin-antitoxin system HicB family antitoxin [Cyanobacteria bacterium J069]